jgi:hypothetical protein
MEATDKVKLEKCIPFASEGFVICLLRNAIEFQFERCNCIFIIINIIAVSFYIMCSFNYMIFFSISVFIAIHNLPLNVT